MRSYELKKQLVHVLKYPLEYPGESLSEDELIHRICCTVYNQIDSALSDHMYALVEIRDRDPDTTTFITQQLGGLAEARKIVEHTLHDWPRHG